QPQCHDAKSEVARDPALSADLHPETSKRKEDPVGLERTAPRVFRLAPRERIVQRPPEVERERDRCRGSRENRSHAVRELLRGKLLPSFEQTGGDREAKQDA